MSKVASEFPTIHRDFRAKILRYLTRLVGEREAEDLTQEVFVKAAAGLNDFRGESQMATWLYRIATNTALDRLRSPSFQRMNQKGLSGEPCGEGEPHEEARTPENTPSVEQDLIRKEMNKCIRDFVENLPPGYRAVMVLSELEELKNKEIAEILGVALDTVKIRLHRARARLKRELESHCEFYRDEQGELACDLKSAFKE